MPRRVYLHIGLPKSGTSAVQMSLWLSREALPAHGYSVPGAEQRTQRLAVYDLLGRRVCGVRERGVAGAWKTLAGQVVESPHNCLVSEELLVHARLREARRVVRSLRPCEPHVVVTVRNLAAAVGSTWQAEIMGGATWTWRDYAASVGGPEVGPPSAGVAFWLRSDLIPILSIWGQLMPPEQVHVVVVPRSGTAHGDLIDVFADAVGLERGVLVRPERIVNPAVGPARAELIRRVNLALDRRLSEDQQLDLNLHVLKRAFRSQAGARRAEPLLIPPPVFSVLEQRARDLIAALAESDYDVHGDVGDLLLHDDDRLGVDPGDIADGRLLEDAVTALAAAGEELVRRRARQGQARASDDLTNSRAATGTRALSMLRAMAFRVRTLALERADTNRVLAWASRGYLRRRERLGR